MKKIYALFYSLLLLTIFAASSSYAELKPVAEFNGGKLFKSGTINVIQLNGSYRQMGQQYGKLLGKEITKLHSELTNQFMANKAIKSYDDFMGQAIYYFNVYPKRFKDILYGISETSGVDLKKIIMINAMMLAQRQGCSEIAGWGTYSGNAPLAFGRNFDAYNYFAGFAPYLVLAVFNPNDGSNSAATLGYAGQIATINALNNKGLIIAANDGCISGDKSRSFNRIPLIINNLQYMFDYSSLKALDFAMKTSMPYYPMVFAAAGPERAYSYELSATNVARADGDPQGLLVATNHFVSRNWKKKLTSDAKDVWYKSVLRRSNLLKLGKNLKGRLNAQNIMTILDRPISAGGVFFPGQQTIYQLVFIPDDMKIWIKAAGLSKWNEIDLTKLFSSVPAKKTAGNK